jgi:hypothetical protein
VDYNPISEKYYRSKWHRCERLFVISKREPAPGREQGHILPFEAIGGLHWKAEATSLHVGPNGVCELWMGADGWSLLPPAATDHERDQRAELLTKERLQQPHMFLSVVRAEDQDGYGLERRTPASVSPLVAGWERGTFVLVVSDDADGSEVEYSAA